MQTSGDAAGQEYFTATAGGHDYRIYNNFGNFDIFDLDDATPRIRIKPSGNIGIGTTGPGKILEINKSTGGELRLTYNDANGSATDYSDFQVGSDGDLTITTVDSDGAAGDIALMPDGNVGINTTSPQEKLAVNGNIVIPKAAGNGILVDLTTPTSGWRDLKGKVTQRNTGGSKPTHATYRGGLKQYQFAVGKEEYFTYHIDHDHLPDSDVFLHVHWSHINGSVTGGSITLEYELAYAKGFNQGAFGVPVSSTYLGVASAVQYQHIISEIQVSAAAPNAASEIDSNDLEPDGIIEARVKILYNNMTGATPDPFIHEADIHYQSTSMGTKQKAPDFYT